MHWSEAYMNQISFSLRVVCRYWLLLIAEFLKLNLLLVLRSHHFNNVLDHVFGALANLSDSSEEEFVVYFHFLLVQGAWLLIKNSLIPEIRLRIFWFICFNCESWSFRSFSNWINWSLVSVSDHSVVIGWWGWGVRPPLFVLVVIFWVVLINVLRAYNLATFNFRYWSFLACITFANHIVFLFLNGRLQRTSLFFCSIFSIDLVCKSDCRGPLHSFIIWGARF